MTFTTVEIVVEPDVPVTVKDAAPVGVPLLAGTLELLVAQPARNKANSASAEKQAQGTSRRGERRQTSVASERSVARDKASSILRSGGNF